MAEIGYIWSFGTTYELTLEAVDSNITLYIDRKKVLEISDNDFVYGMYGCGSLQMGRTLFGDFIIEEY